MKKIVSLLVLSLLTISLVACSGGDKPSEESSTTASEETAATETATATSEITTIKPGKLLVGMQVDYAPFEQYAEDGITAVGLDCDIIEAIASKMGLEVEYVDTAWEGIFAGLDTDKYDCIISGVTITDEREAAYDFTQSYVENYQCMVVLKDTAITAKSPSETAGLNVAYQSETTSDIYITDLIDKGLDVNVFEYEKILECFTELEVGRVDAVVCDSTVTYPFINKENSPYEIVWKQEEAPEEMGIMVKSGNTSLLTALDNGLTDLKNDGSLDSFMMTWFSK